MAGPSLEGSSRSRNPVIVELLVMLAGVAASSFALYLTLRQLDPNRAQAKQAKQKKKEIARRLGRPMIQTNAYEDIIACDVVNPEHIEVTFSSIGGLDPIKQSLHELIVLPLLRPELFAHGKLLKPQKGVLLYGPPGTGKTLLAKAVAKECKAAFINIRIASLMSKWFGDAQKLVTAVFTLAHKLQPAIIFIDEIDSFLGQRKQSDHEAVTSMKTEFMSLWDGFSTDECARVMVLCATNRPWDLDEAILRRLPRSFEIPLPDVQGRANILRVILKGERVEAGFNFEAVAAKCEGYSGSDLTELCKQAAYFPLRDFLKAEREAADANISTRLIEKRPLSEIDFLTVLRESPPARDAAEEYRRRRSRGTTGTPGVSPSQDDAVKLEQFLKLMWMLRGANGTSGGSGAAPSSGGNGAGNSSGGDSSSGGSQ